MELCGARGKDRSGDDNSGYTNQFIHRVGGEFSELQHVQPGSHENLDIGNCLRGSIASICTCEREEDCTRSFGSSVFKLVGIVSVCRGYCDGNPHTNGRISVGRS